MIEVGLQNVRRTIPHSAAYSLIKYLQSNIAVVVFLMSTKRVTVSFLLSPNFGVVD